MTDKERDRRFRATQNAVLKRRIRLQADTHAEIQRLLALALKDVKTALAAAPSDFAAWYLPQLQAEIERVLKATAEASAGALGPAAEQAWQLGLDYLDQPLAAAGVRIPGVLPHLDTGQLAAMKTFMSDRIRDVSSSAINRINTELGLTLIGARPMSDTISRVQDLLGGASRTRATTIVRTELGRAFSVAAEGRARQAAETGVEMDKVWRRSGKRHPRVSHAFADGQRVPVDEPFLVGGVKLMHPHDPAAPAAHTINCGCIALYRPRGWASTTPDHKPFTDKELALNPKLAERVEARETGKPITRPPSTPPPKPKRVFEVQASAKAAAKWAMDNDLADYADYGRIHADVANAWNQSLFEHLQAFPELRKNQKFTGTAQAQFTRWHEMEVARYVEQIVQGGADRETAEKWARLRIKKPKNAGWKWAHSMSHRDVSGVAVNEKWGKAVDDLRKSLADNVKSGFHPPGCDTIKSIVDHELGHQLDTLCYLSDDPEMKKLYTGLKASKGVKDAVSGYADKNIAEFIAESWAEYRNNPAPRDAARAVGAIIEDRYRRLYPART